jgi:hypothetical protein
LTRTRRRATRRRRTSQVQPLLELGRRTKVIAALFPERPGSDHAEQQVAERILRLRNQWGYWPVGWSGYFDNLPTERNTVNDYNREAFVTALRATGASTFQEARAVLAEIKEERISDPDVAKYVEFCKDLAKYCLDHGIQRGSEINPWSILVNADKKQTARTLLRRWWQRGVAGPVVSAVEGVWLAVRLRGWFKLQEKLFSKYPLILG